MTVIVTLEITKHFKLAIAKLKIGDLVIAESCGNMVTKFPQIDGKLRVFVEDFDQSHSSTEYLVDDVICEDFEWIDSTVGEKKPKAYQYFCTDC